MRSIFKAVGVLTLSMLLTSNAAFACHSCNKGGRSHHHSGYKPYVAGKHTPYYEALTSYYTQYAVKQSERGADSREVSYFYDKASKAQKGRVRAENIQSGADHEELKNARKLLVNNTDNLTKGRHPEHLAAAHFYYDCWAAGYKFKHDKACYHCRDNFYKYINMVLNDRTNYESGLSINQSQNLEKYFNDRHLIGTMYFAFDVYKNVLNTDVQTIVSDAAMAASRGCELVVVGYADTVGTKHYNSLLSLNRAKKVRSLLIDGGAEVEGIDIVAFGESKVSKDYSTVTYSDSANRRVEIYAVKKQRTTGCNNSRY